MVSANQVSTFMTTRMGEPHAPRRKDLLARYPEIRSLFGFDRRTAWVTAAVVLAQLGIAAWLGLQGRMHRPLGHIGPVLLVAYALGALLTHWLSTTIHETSHRLAAKSALGNDAVALLANVPMVLPIALTFHRYHLGHHKYLGVLGYDTDLPHRLEVAHIGRSTLRKLAWVLMHPIVYIARGATYAKRPNRGEILNALFLVLIDIAIVRYLGPIALVYLALSFFFAHGLHPIAAHFVHDHYTDDSGQETFSYYGPLNWVTFNLGYHVEHHDFMQIPGWRLPKLYRMVPDYAGVPSSRSYAAAVWRFITDPRIGYPNRVVRTRDDFRRARSRTSRPSAPHLPV